MMYSYRIEQAIRAAGALHDGERRKGKIPYPYVTHPFAVACIIADYTDDEDTIIAGLLHDTIEDTGYTFAELEEDFGPSVSAIVKAVTKPEMRQGEGRSDWKEGRERYVAQLRSAADEALVVAAADKIHNMRGAIEEYHNDRARFGRDFGGTQEERMTIYQSISNILNRRLHSDIVHEFNHVFDEYKKFIYENPNS